MFQLDSLFVESSDVVSLKGASFAAHEICYSLGPGHVWHEEPLDN